MSSGKEIWTIGHSNHSIEAFISLLGQHKITALADVRSHPYSRYLPHFTQAALKTSLAKAGIRYVFLGKELGARPNNPDCYVDGKALYEKIAATELFAQGIQRLLKGVETYKISLMCAEKDPITCHRAILVCQNLRQFDLEINHILNDGNLEPHHHLEDRLLNLYGLSDAEQNKPKQLSLFDNLELQNFEIRPREERLKESYHLQGEQIAYQEKTDDATN
jgi:uncharacterized protein (DUF488 family)